MNKLLCLWLLLVLSLLLSLRTAKAQPIKPSHRDLPSGFDEASAEELMAQRLYELQELHQLQDRVQGLLKDKELLESLKGRFSESELQQLRGKLLKGQGLSHDKNWEWFLDRVRSRPNWNKQQVEMLSRWANRAEKQRIPSAFTPMLRGPGAVDPPRFPDVHSSPSLSNIAPPTAEPAPSLFDRMQKESSQWLMDNVDGAGGKMLEALTQMDERFLAEPGNEGFLAELMRTVRQADFADMNLSDNSLFPTLRVGTLANSLSNMGDFLHPQGGVWDDMRSRFHDSPAISLPRFGHSVAVASASPALDGNGGAPAFLSVLMLGAIVVLLCKRIFGSKSSAFDENARWRLGPWPVPPSRVSTRQDLIRVFEHLALLCFGPSAVVCHHRALAARLAERDSGNPRRQQAAEALAWLYEQARYAPAEDALSPEQLSDARHALCLLAGVTAL